MGEHEISQSKIKKFRFKTNKYIAFIYATILSILVYTLLIEIFAPARVQPAPQILTEKEKIDDIASRYVDDIKSPIIKTDYTNYPKIVNILATSDIGFNLFYFGIFLTFWLQLFYAFRDEIANFVAVDLNLQAPPMLGVGGTIYALVNVNLNDSASIVVVLSAVLIGAGLTTLLGIFIYIINHSLTRYIKTH